jgi:hypothetical protein
VRIHVTEVVNFNDDGVCRDGWRRDDDRLCTGDTGKCTRAQRSGDDVELFHIGGEMKGCRTVTHRLR